MQLQRVWRTAGLVLIGVSGVMVFVGPDAHAARAGSVFFATYWLFFLLFFLGALYCVLLDVRYIRLQYHLARRRLFQETVGSEPFRRALKEADTHGEGPATPSRAKEER